MGPVTPVGPVAPVGPVSPVGPVGPAGPGAPLPAREISTRGSCDVFVVSLLSKKTIAPVDTTARPLFEDGVSIQSFTAEVMSMLTNWYRVETPTPDASVAPVVGSGAPVTVDSVQALVTRSTSAVPPARTLLMKRVSVALVTSLLVVAKGRFPRSTLTQAFWVELIRRLVLAPKFDGTPFTV